MRKGLIRSFLQVALLCAAAFVMSDARVQAQYEQWCLDRATACSQMCGSTVTSQLQYMVCVEYRLPPNQWQCASGGWRGAYEWGWASGIANFECDEVANTSWCQCAY